MRAFGPPLPRAVQLQYAEGKYSGDEIHRERPGAEAYTGTLVELHSLTLDKAS